MAWGKQSARATALIIVTVIATTALFITVWWNRLDGKELFEKKVREYTFEKLGEPYTRSVVKEVATSNAQFVASNVAVSTAIMVATQQATLVARTVAASVALSNAQHFVSEKLTPFEKRVGELTITITTQREEIAKILGETESRLEETTNALVFVELVAAALTLDRKAYEDLAVVELSTNAPLNDIAWRARHIVPIFARLMRVSEKGLNIDPIVKALKLDSMTFTAFTNEFAHIPQLFYRCAMLTYLLDQKRFPTSDVLDFLTGVIETERNILVLEHAIGLVDTKAKLGQNFWAVKNTLNGGAPIEPVTFHLRAVRSIKRSRSKPVSLVCRKCPGPMSHQRETRFRRERESSAPFNQFPRTGRRL